MKVSHAAGMDVYVSGYRQDAETVSDFELGREGKKTICLSDIHYRSLHTVTNNSLEILSNSMLIFTEGNRLHRLRSKLHSNEISIVSIFILFQSFERSVFAYHLQSHAFRVGIDIERILHRPTCCDIDNATK